MKKELIFQLKKAQMELNVYIKFIKVLIKKLNINLLFVMNK